MKTTRERIHSETDRAPAQIALGDARYPANLREIGTPPERLYVRGEFEERDALAIAIVGSRAATSYGLAVAERLAADLAARGVTVVSGLARGIDSAAHRGALRAGGRTIAVLGSGVDVIYPPENRRLAGDIAAHGAVVSQFEPGTRPFAGNFPARNRVIAGLALGVVVVEAAEKSGSLITAGLAGDLGREVMAVPGLLTSAQSAGAHRLIQDGAALIQNWEDVVGLLPLHWRGRVQPAPKTATGMPATEMTGKTVPGATEAARNTTEAATNSTETATNSTETATNSTKASRHATMADTHTSGPNHLAHGQHAERHVEDKSDKSDKLDQDSLLRLIGEDPADIDGIIDRSGLTPGRASALLVTLEVEGRIRQLEGKRFVQVSLG